MKRKRLFLQWALFVSLLCVGVMIASFLGWLGLIFQGDPTHITYVTFGVFILATTWCGLLSWQFSDGRLPDEVEEDLAHSRFASSLCVSIGLIGTAIGYYIMLKNGDATGEPSEVIRQAFANTSIAIVNTIFGGVCGVLIELQSHFIGHAVTKTKRSQLPSMEPPRHPIISAAIAKAERQMGSYPPKDGGE